MVEYRSELTDIYNLLDIYYKKKYKTKKVNYEKIYFDATRNKIEFTYLTKVFTSENVQINDVLYYRYKKLFIDYKKFLESLKQTSELLNNIGIKYATIKTLYPFPTLPGDIDILIFEDFNRVLEIFKENDYLIFDRGPHFVSLHNINIDKPKHLGKKRLYDIDLYNEIALSYFVYLDKNIFSTRRCVYKEPLLNYSIETFCLSNEDELLLQINHSMFEHLFTLLHFYSSAYLMTHVDLNKFLKIVYETKSSHLIKKAFDLMGKIVYSVYINNMDNLEKGMKKIIITAKALGIDNFFEDNFELPYRFEVFEIIKAVTEKTLHYYDTTTTIKSLRNIPDIPTITHIIKELNLRRRRISY